jgi:hypothetical protein
MNRRDNCPCNISGIRADRYRMSLLVRGGRLEVDGRNDIDLEEVSAPSQSKIR